MYIPTLASIFSLQHLYFYRAQLKCVDSLNTEKYVSVIKEGYCIICYYYVFIIYKDFLHSVIY